MVLFRQQVFHFAIPVCVQDEYDLVRNSVARIVVTATVLYRCNRSTHQFQ